MGVTEEAGRVATNVVDGLKASPSCLAAIVLSIFFVGLGFWASRERDREFHARNMALLDRCFPQTESYIGQAYQWHQEETERERARARARLARQGESEEEP